MTPVRRSISATKVARDFGESLGSFLDSVHGLIAELGKDESSKSAGECCRETCAAVWAAAMISLDASALRADERDALASLIFATLLPYLKKHCGASDCASAKLRDHANRYLELRQAHSQVNTATHIVARLLEALKVSDGGKRRLAKRLAALFAHRMLGDIHKLNELKLHFGIQLSLITGFVSGLPLLQGSEALLLLRLC